jgi:hypothetical protein
MKRLTSLVVLLIAGFSLAVAPAAAAPADVGGTWEVTIPYKEGDQDARFVLTQDGEKVAGSYHGLGGPATVDGTFKAGTLVLTVKVTNSAGDPITARFTGKVAAEARMAGTVTFATSGSPPAKGDQAATKWTAERR